jgi:integrase
MASHHMLSGGRKARIVFRYRGTQYSRTIAVESPRDAEMAASRVDLAIDDLARGRLSMPDWCDPGDFLVSGGREVRRVVPEVGEPAPPPPLTVAGLFDRHARELTPGTKEASTLGTEAVHARHFARLLGPGTPLESVDLAAIQGYSDRRAAEGVARVTIGKELGTLLSLWGWASRRGIAAAGPAWARKDVTRPKGAEKPPFMTWEQVEREVAAERPDPATAAGRRALDALWERLWLDQARTVACVAWVREHARHPFMPAMVAFAAYTGARRSEIIRSRRSDWDLGGGTVSIRQKKADTSREFTRRTVDVHPDLAGAMREWFARMPHSAHAISTADGEPIGRRMATKYLRATLDGGPWRVVHGWHTFRHSLASNMASAGVDQRVIDEVLGHQTEEMSRRYRHLHPNNARRAIAGLFLGGPS